MRFIILLLIFFGLFPLGVLAHDLYLAYQDAEQSNVQFGDKPLRFSDIGWLWIQYSPDTYDWARRAVAPDTWQKLIDPVLGQTALIVTCVPPALLAVLLFLLKLFKNVPFVSRLSGGGRAKGGSISLHGVDKTKNRMNYKRK